MKVLINSLLMSVLLTGILALVGDGYAMYWAGVELKFKNKKWRALFKVLPVLSIVILAFLFMRYD